MPLPRYNIPGIFKLRKKIMDDIDIIGFLDSEPRGDDFDEFVSTLHGLLPQGIPRSTVYDSCMAFAGVKLTQEALDDLVWRMAGNVGRMRVGHPVHPWSGQDVGEWVPVQTVNVAIAASRKGKYGGVFTLKVLAGSPCPMELQHFWTSAYCQIVRHELGFSKYSNGPHAFWDIRELVNFRFFVRIVPDQVELELDKIAIPPSMQAWNKKYISRRSRPPGGFVCPKNFDLVQKCHQCFVGQDQCPVATHATTYIAVRCKSCGQNGWFEHENDAACISCRTNEALQRKDQKP